MRTTLALCIVATACAWHAPITHSAHGAKTAHVMRWSHPPMLAAANAAPPSLLTQIKQTSAAAMRSGAAAFSSRALPVKVGLAVLALAFAVFLIEIKKRLELIRAGDQCMNTGDEDTCELYDDSIEKTPIWKLNMAYNKLVQTNTLAAKLAGPPPKGFEWGRIL
jgi:hypothetical protein